MPMTVPIRPVVRTLGHTTVVLALLTVGYYALPLRLRWDETGTFVRLGISVTALSLLAAVFRIQLRWSRRLLPVDYLRIQYLLSALYLLILAFSVAYALMGVYAPAQFAGIEDRTDALYFSVTLVATVGFGDIHPVGTAAQLLATVHMLFNLVYLGTAFRLLSGFSPSHATPTPTTAPWERPG